MVADSNKSPKLPLPDDQVGIASNSFWIAAFQTFINKGFPLIAPFNIGPPKSDKSVDSIAAISNCDPVQTPVPTRTSPWIGSLQPAKGSQVSKIPFESKTPISSPISNDEIVDWKITNWKLPVSNKSKL